MLFTVFFLQDKLKIQGIIHKFASGLETLLGDLVQGMTAPTASNSTKSRRGGRNEMEEMMMHCLKIRRHQNLTVTEMGTMIRRLRRHQDP